VVFYSGGGLNRNGYDFGGLFFEEIAEDISARGAEISDIWDGAYKSPRWGGMFFPILSITSAIKFSFIDGCCLRDLPDM
jgi:hypothetical protein